MRRINLKNDFKINPATEKRTAQELTITGLIQGTQSGYKTLTADKRRLWAKLGEKIEMAGKDKADFIDINDIEYLFMKAGFDNGIVESQYAAFVTVAEEALFNSATVSQAESEADKKSEADKNVGNPGLKPLEVNADEAKK